MANFNTIKQNITQVILIVFSVVLGLYLSERIEEGKNKQASDNLLAKITSEVNDNIILMDEWALYHQQIKGKLDSLSKDEVFIEQFIQNKSILLEKLLTRGTFMARRPSSDAWDIAKSHPLIVNFDYDKLVILSKIYNQQKITFEPGTEMFEIYKSKDVNLRKDAKLNLGLMSNRFRELIAREKQLMYYYKKSEEILGLKDNKELDN